MFGGRGDEGGEANRHHLRVVSQRFLHGQAEAGLGFADGARCPLSNSACQSVFLSIILFAPTDVTSEVLIQTKPQFVCATD